MTPEQMVEPPLIEIEEDGTIILVSEDDVVEIGQTSNVPNLDY